MLSLTHPTRITRSSAIASLALRLKPVAVPAEVQRPKLLARLADQIALAHKHLVADQRRASPTVPSLQRTTARRLASESGGRSSNRRTSSTTGLASGALTAVSLPRPPPGERTQLALRPPQLAVDGPAGLAGQLGHLLAAVAGDA